MSERIIEEILRHTPLSVFFRFKQDPDSANFYYDVSIGVDENEPALAQSEGATNTLDMNYLLSALEGALLGKVIKGMAADARRIREEREAG